MKGLKYFTVFFVYPVALIVVGFVCGVTCVKIFYPGTFQVTQEQIREEDDQWQKITGTPDNMVS